MCISKLFFRPYILFIIINMSILAELQGSIINLDSLSNRSSNYTYLLKGKNSEDRPLILSPLIETFLDYKIEEARKLAFIHDNHLLNIPSYSGFLTVEKKYGSNMWFWYIPAEGGNIKEKPLLIWFQGGPGDTSMYGMFKELGPFRIDSHGGLPRANPYTWHKNYSLLFFDNPVGVGYSFSQLEEGISKSLIQVTKNLYEAVKQFLVMFSELKNVPLYLAGESYAGKYIPYLANEIHANNPSAFLKINLQGIAIGNGFIDPPTILKTSSVALSHGFINENTAAALKKDEANIEELFKQGKLEDGISAWESYLSKSWETTSLPNIYNYADDNFEDVYDDVKWMEFIVRPEIRKALHVGNIDWDSNKELVRASLRNELYTSAKPMLENLLQNKYKVMLYSGDLDMMVPYKLSLDTYKTLNWTGSSEYLTAERKPWKINGTLAGYITKASNFVEVMVRNAGHMVPADQPLRTQALMLAFTSGQIFNEKAYENGFDGLLPRNSAATQNNRTYIYRVLKVLLPVITSLTGKIFSHGKFL